MAMPTTPRRYVVTGTDTNVGKTVVAAGLVAALDGEYWKPVQSGLGGQTDTETVGSLSGLPPDRFHTEAYRLNAPLAPLHAANVECVTIDEARLVPPLTSRPLIIEGAGGLLVPVTRNVTMADLFARWRIPVVLVARTALGTINHTLLSVEAMRARHIPIAGVVFIGGENAPTEHHIASFGAIRHLGRLPHLAPLDQGSLASAVAASLDLAAFIGEVEP